MSLKLIVIEDEYAIALDIETRLTKMGYNVLEIGDSFQQAIQLVSEHEPDLVVMDIHISGTQTGIDAAKVIQESFDIPVVFLTAHTDTSTFEKALGIKPFGYILKPFKSVQLKNAIELAIVNHKEFKKKKMELLLLKDGLQKLEEKTPESETIFVKDKGQLTSISIANIIRLEAMDNYTVIYTDKGKHVVGLFLKDVSERLSQKEFLRVHRSHVINISKIEHIDGHLVFIQGKGVPVSKGYKPDLMKRLDIL